MTGRYPDTEAFCPINGKHAFASRREARRRLRSRRGQLGFTAVREYRCPRCGAWHLTSQQPRGP